MQRARGELACSAFHCDIDAIGASKEKLSCKAFWDPESELLDPSDAQRFRGKAATLD